MHNFISHGLHLHNISVVTLGYRLASPGSGLDHCVDDVIKGIEKVQELFPSSTISVSGLNRWIPENFRVQFRFAVVFGKAFVVS